MNGRGEPSPLGKGPVDIKEQMAKYFEDEDLIIPKDDVGQPLVVEEDPVEKRGYTRDINKTLS